MKQIRERIDLLENSFDTLQEETWSLEQAKALEDTRSGMEAMKNLLKDQANAAIKKVEEQLY